MATKFGTGPEGLDARWSPATSVPVSRLLLGEWPLTDHVGETLLPEAAGALPGFLLRPLSSVAYATEQIMLVLGLGGLALLYLTPWLGATVVLLLIVVAPPIIFADAYPNGGGRTR